VGAVLDRLHAGERRALHALGRLRVHRDGATAAVGGRHQRVHLLLAEGGHGLAVRAPAVVAIQLDPVGAVADLVAHHARALLDAGGLLRALGGVEGVARAARAVAAGGDDGARRGDDARARHDALLDRVLELHVAGERALGAEVARGGDAGLERGARV